MNGTTRTDRKKHLAACQANAWAEVGDDAQAIADQHPDWTAEQIADAIDQVGLPAPPLSLVIYCGTCGTHGDHATENCTLPDEEADAR